MIISVNQLDERNGAYHVKDGRKCDVIPKVRVIAGAATIFYLKIDNNLLNQSTI